MGGFAWLIFLAAGEAVSSSSSSKVDGAPVAHPRAMVFYNLFSETTDVPRVANIVEEQLSLLDPKRHELWVNSIGALRDPQDLHLSNTHLAESMTFVHYSEGQEPVSLHSLWSYCKREDVPESQVVIYIHSKGSFHDHPFQAPWRQYITAGALAEECRTMPEQCNVCSSRMTPVPYPHVPGNMWAARCSYVRKLSDPMDFEHVMDEYQRLLKGRGAGCPPFSGCWGLKRLSSEHWIQAHPEMKPCDLDDQLNYTWGVPEKRNVQAVLDFVNRTKVLKEAPRFHRDAFLNLRATCGRCGRDIGRRFSEYEFLYQQRPDHTWWGWKWFT